MSDETKAENPVIADIKKYDLQSAIAVAGHPLHAVSYTHLTLPTSDLV